MSDFFTGDFFTIYLLCWGSACVIAIGIFIHRFKTWEITRRAYWQFLLQPWKIATFSIAALGLILIAPYTNDITWDYVDAAFMSILTFVTAPWAVGVLYQTLRGRRAFGAAYVACCAWMFSASWSYDLYLLIRDGSYPETWDVNIAASSILYFAAGLLWSLDYRSDKGVTFAFMNEPWPSGQEQSAFCRIVGYALPFMLIVSVAILSFVW